MPQVLRVVALYDQAGYVSVKRCFNAPDTGDDILFQAVWWVAFLLDQFVQFPAEIWRVKGGDDIKAVSLQFQFLMPGFAGSPESETNYGDVAQPDTPGCRVGLRNARSDCLHSTSRANPYRCRCA